MNDFLRFHSGSFSLQKPFLSPLNPFRRCAMPAKAASSGKKAEKALDFIFLYA